MVLLVLDEPLSMLDARARQRIFVALQEAHSHGTGLFVIDHQLDTYGDAPNSVALMQGGTVSSQRTPIEIGAALCQQPGSAVAPPAAALWWSQHVLSLLKHHRERDLNGLIRPQLGEVRIYGKRTGNRPVAELAHVIGYAPQRPERLFFCATVAEELAVGPRALGLHAATKAAQASLIEAFDLGSLLDRSPYTLSVGEQRRVGLAAVLASQPQVIALDEPTAGLDAPARATLASLLRELANRGAAVVMVTHDIEFAAATASRWFVLIAGRLVADDVPVRNHVECPDTDRSRPGTECRLPTRVLASSATSQRAGFGK